MPGRGRDMAAAAMMARHERMRARMRVLMVMAALAALAGCNTVAGVGEDITGVARWAQQGLGGVAGGGGYQ